QARVVRRDAAAYEARAFLLADADVPHDLLVLLAAGDAPDLAVGIRRQPAAQGAHLLGDVIHHLIVNRLVQERARGRAARLARGPLEVHAVHRGGGDLPGISVGVGDERVLAAQF